MNKPRRPSLLALLVAVLIGAPLARESFAGGVPGLAGFLGTIGTGFATFWSGFLTPS